MGRAVQDQWPKCLLKRWWQVGHCGAGICTVPRLPPRLLPECRNYGSVTTLDWGLLPDKTSVNLSLSPAPRAEPGKTRGAWYLLAE